MSARDTSATAPFVVRYLLTHPEHGIFLGTCAGLGFWSAVDPAGQDEAPTFPTEATIQAHLDSWDEPPVGPERLRYKAHEVIIPRSRINKDGSAYATLADVREAGLEPWDPAHDPDFNPAPYATRKPPVTH